ncbi:MAG: photosynthetic complex assembly protein PuhC [Methyloversatilis sp.]|jgi:putative photosynthetic complex assembly protein|nr:photosynthetic complex assembly protein PuhC [Methyloversatilis sp.]
MSAHSAPALPRWPLLAIGLMLAGVLAAVALVRVSGTPIAAPDAPAIAERALRFEDRPDGSIAVIDARTGTQIDAFVGEQGFVRGTLRGLVRERRRQQIGPEQPFSLVARADGRLTLIDPGTARRVDLESFGPVNAGAFGRLLDAGRPTLHASGAQP